eukprot:48812-Eustigmatos_ZCMA.PRE.1
MPSFCAAASTSRATARARVSSAMQGTLRRASCCYRVGHVIMMCHLCGLLPALAVPQAHKHAHI